MGSVNHTASSRFIALDNLFLELPLPLVLAGDIVLLLENDDNTASSCLGSDADDDETVFVVAAEIRVPTEHSADM